MTSAVLLENGNTRFTLLSRDGDVYREKPIAPKRDWMMYDGSHTGNRYSTLDQINAVERAAARARVDAADAGVAAAAHACRGRRHHVRHRVERAAGGRCDDGSRAVVLYRSRATAASSARPASG